MQLTKHQRRPRLELQLRHHPDNLQALYRESQDPIERALWLLAKGQSIPQVASNLGYSERWVRSLIHRYNQGLPMKNLRHQNKGQAPLLSPELQEAFYQALRKPHPRDGLWTPPGGLASGWDVRWTPGGPGAGCAAWALPPCAHDPATGRPTPRRGPLSKKTLPDGFLVEAALPLEVWAFAAHRLGLKPIRRRVWAPPARERPRYRWLS